MKIERTNSRFLFIALVGLVAVLILLAVLVFNYVLLHNAFLDSNAEILNRIDELQETTDQLQETIDSLLIVATGEVIPSNDLIELDHLLDQIDAELADIEDTIEDTGFTVVDEFADSQLNVLPDLADEEVVGNIQADINQTFTLIAWLIGGISLITAALLTTTLNARRQSRRRRKRVPAAAI